MLCATAAYAVLRGRAAGPARSAPGVPRGESDAVGAGVPRGESDAVGAGVPRGGPYAIRASYAVGAASAAKAARATSIASTGSRSGSSAQKVPILPGSVPGPSNRTVTRPTPAP